MSHTGLARYRARVRRAPHENVATVLVAPSALRELELQLMSRDLWVWPIATTATGDGARLAFQTRRRLLMARRGAWDLAADWTPVWIAFGESWHDGDEPLPWAAHSALWEILAQWPAHTRYRLGLGGIPKLAVHRESA